MAHKKGVGSSENGRESESKRLGVKLFGGEFAKAGNIIVRQRGTAHHPGENVGIGKDHTIYALIDGTVVFRKTRNNRSYISVKGLDVEPVKAEVAPKAAKVKEAPAVVAEVEAVVETAVEVETVVEAAAEEKPKKAAKPKAEAKPKAAAKPKAKKEEAED